MNSDDILNIKEVSDYLKIPVSTVYKLAQDGKVPAVKVGKHWRFLKKDLELLFVQNQKRNDFPQPFLEQGKS
jgi:excisionase family DNA binding protein